VCKLSFDEYLGNLPQGKGIRVMTNDPSDDLTPEEEKAVKWLEAGFSRYANMCGRRGRQTVASIKALHDKLGLPYRRVQKYLYQGEVHKNICIQIKQYGDWFGRLLRGKETMPEEDDSRQLRLDLSLLYA
jgi:hypothetical protein